MCGRCTARLAAMPWLSKWPKILRNGGKNPCQTDYKLLQRTTIFIFNLTCLLWHQSSRENHRFPNCMSWSLDGSENVCRHLVIKTCTASSYLACHETCAELQKRKHAEKRKKTEDEPVEHRDYGTQKLCENRCSIYVITHITRFRLDGIELQWAIIQSQSWFRGYDYSAYCYVNFDCVSGETGD